MNPKSYQERLGTLWTNLHSLEMALRVFLDHVSPSGRTEDIYQMPVGSSISSDALTNYDALGKLIRKYNEHVGDTGEKIPDSLVDLRDALAHGRMSASVECGSPMRLIKFSPVKDGQVTVVVNENMTSEWFDAKIKLVYDNIQTVAKAVAEKNRKKNTSRFVINADEV